MPILADHSALDTSLLPSSDAQPIGEAYRHFLDRIGEALAWLRDPVLQ
jgi:hypothetical protein